MCVGVENYDVNSAILMNCSFCVFQSALGWDHQSELAKHASQTDAAKGFGGKYGVQKDRKDKVCEHVHVCAIV